MFTLRNVSTGSQVPAEGDQLKQLITLSQGGRLQRAAEEGRLFSVANQAAVATTAALATTWTGLGVCNPTGSGKNLIMHEFGYAMTVVGSDDGAVGLMTTTSSGITAAVIAARSRFFGTGTSVAYPDDGATIAAPVLEQVFGVYGTGATNLYSVEPSGPIDLKGGLIIAPGRSVLSYTTTATTATFIFHFVWEEVPE